MIKTISLDKLVVSPRNVRRSGDPKADAELKADIEAHGLLQNLVVTAVKKPRGCFAVEAGERRRRALQALADDGGQTLSALIASLPLVSMLGIIWLWRDKPDVPSMAAHVEATFHRPQSFAILAPDRR